MPNRRGAQGDKGVKVHLTFDVEIWCDGWKDLDRRFPEAFDRYVFGRSSAGSYALPATLEILNRHGLKGVFFVEPLFSARFGAEYLERTVRLIEDAGQDVQLHLHPEWVDEISPPPLVDVSRKRQYLSFCTKEEQTTLLQYGLTLLQRQTRNQIYAFRAGSYAANRDTYAALSAVGLSVDSSLNRAYAISGPDVVEQTSHCSAFQIDGISAFPVSVFVDGFGRVRPAQINACGFREMCRALESSAMNGRMHFVIVSHNFEMLRDGGCEPDRFVVRRFENLCCYLASQRDRYDVCTFPRGVMPTSDSGVARTTAWSTVLRLGEQAARRWM